MEHMVAHWCGDVDFHVEVRKEVCVRGIDHSTHWEDIFVRAMDEEQIGEWQREVQKPTKARCMYEVASDVFSGENVSDNNVRLVHVENAHKLRMYALFKTQLQPERYLLCVENKQERMMLACFWAGVLPLRIETGRYEFGGIQGKRARDSN